MGVVRATVEAGLHVPRVSIVIATRNRREILLNTLDHVMHCGLDASEFEVIIVDNASSDGTTRAIGEGFPETRVLRLRRNHGPCAKNAGVAVARGELIVFLDDDSYPRPGSIGRMIEHFGRDPKLGAAAFTVTLPDGSRECSAYPDVCIGCGTGFRRAALLQAGGLPDDFFMAAEEYDLSLRMLDAGWRVKTFDDLHVMHLKTPMSRFATRIARLDARNNAILAMRYFPEPWRMAYAISWLERYRLMAMRAGHRAAFWAGACAGILRGITTEHRPIGPEAFEQFSRREQTYRRLARAARGLGLRRVLFVDLGKNILAYQAAAARCGIEVVGIADLRLSGAGLRYQGLQILTDGEAARLRFDAVVISNLSPVHAPLSAARWRARGRWPVLDLFPRGKASSPAQRDAA